MKSRPTSASTPVQKLIDLVHRLPEVEEGISCDKTAFKAGKKSFLFLAVDEPSYEVMVKLGDSLVEAVELARKQPECCKVGVHGWVTATFPQNKPLPSFLERWVQESYRLLAPKKLVARLDS